MSAEPETIRAWRALLAQPRAALEPSEVREDSYYGQLYPLTLVRDPSVFPGNLYFDGDAPVLAYVEQPERFAPDVTAAALLALVGEDAERLASRASKPSRLLVAAERGIAISARLEQSVDYLELFAPMSAEEYRRRLYAQPPAFQK